MTGYTSFVSMAGLAANVVEPEDIHVSLASVPVQRVRT
jgi:hypothetical protein